MQSLGAPSLLGPEDEVLLLLIYLRHYLVDGLLGLIFGVSKRSAINTRNRMLDFFYNLLAPSLELGTAEWRLKNSKELYSIFTYVLDGSEQPVLASDSPQIDLEYYSVKKKKHTINTIVMINVRTRRIIYVSPSYPGSYNDSDILKETSEEWFPKLDPNECGMGDNGFEGFESLRISTPPANTTLAKTFSKYRVRIENTIASLKDWKALKYQLRIPPSKKANILSLHHKMWVIVSVFVNDFCAERKI